MQLLVMTMLAVLFALFQSRLREKASRNFYHIAQIKDMLVFQSRLREKRHATIDEIPITDLIIVVSIPSPGKTPRNWNYHEEFFHLVDRFNPVSRKSVTQLGLCLGLTSIGSVSIPSPGKASRNRADLCGYQWIRIVSIPSPGKSITQRRSWMQMSKTIVVSIPSPGKSITQQIEQRKYSYCGGNVSIPSPGKSITQLF